MCVTARKRYRDQTLEPGKSRAVTVICNIACESKVMVVLGHVKR